MDDRIVIGRFEVQARPRPIRIEAGVAPETDPGTVWLTRIDPGPSQLLGYVLEAHAPGARFQSYTADLPEATAEALRGSAVALWAEASSRGQVSAERAASPVRLGLEIVDGLRMDFTWERPGTVVLAFRDLEPERLGTVTGLDEAEHCLRAAPPHTAWADEPGRAERLIAAAAHAYRRRPEPD